MKKIKLYLLTILLCTGLISKAQQDIEVTLNEVVLTSGVSSFDFGSVMIDAPPTNVAVATNVGDAALTFDVLDAVTITGTNAADFSIIGTISGEALAAGENIGISISMEPTTAGAKTATVTINSDDPDEDPFTFTIIGTAVAKPADCVIPTMDLESFYKGSVAAIDFGTGEVTGVTNYSAPAGWAPLLAQLFAVFGQNINVRETADARTGSSALELFGDGTGISDLVTVIPCGNFPASFGGYLKFNPGSGGEEATITISTGGSEEENQTVANTNSITIGTTVSTYTQFDLPFNYDANSVDELFIYIVSSAGAGTSLILDDLSITPGSGLSDVPFDPNPVTFTDLTTTSFTVNWTEPNDHGSAITGYTLQEKVGVAGSYSTVYTGTDLSYSATGLTTGETYFYQVLATNAEGSSGYSVEASAIPSTVITMAAGTVSTCEGLFVDTGGSSGDYSNNENITITIQPATLGDNVSVSFTSFDIENNFDFLKIYDGPTTSSPLLANLTGTSIPSDYTASGAGGELTFNFASDGLTAQAGWQASLSCVTPALAPPNKPASVTFSAVSATQVTVNWVAPGDNGSAITNYTLDQKIGAAGSYSTVFTGTDLSYMATGLTEDETYYFKVKATNAQGDSDFSDEVSVLATNDVIMSNTTLSTCNAPFFDSGGFLGGYSDNEDLTLTIAPDNPGDLVSVTFISLDLEDGFDFLRIYDGPAVDPAKILQNLTGTTSSDVTSSSSGGELTFQFISDGSFTATGWEATLSCVPPPFSVAMSDGVISTCDALFFDSGGSASNYSDNEDLTLTIEPATLGGKVSISFTSFDLEDGFDFLNIHDGPNISSPLLATNLTGTTFTDVVATGSGGELTFHFTSDVSFSGTGWEATLNCVINSTTWNGSLWDNGNPDVSTYAIIDGAYTGAGFICSNLDVNVGNTLTISSGTLEIMGEFNNVGNTIIESGSSLITYEGFAGSGNTPFIQRNTRYSDGKYSFVGSPVQQDASIIGSDLGTFVYGYDETIPYGANDGLNRWVDASSDQLVPGTGYTQAFQQEIIFNGVPNTGTITHTGTYTEDTDDLNEGWNLVSNPYPAAINVDDFLTENTNITGAVYFWDDNGSSTQRGSNADYVIANATVATNTTPAGGENRYNQHIGSAQGFFVKFNNNSDTNVDFTEAMRVSENNDDGSFFRTTETTSVTRLNLTGHNGLFKQTVIVWAEDAKTSQMNRMYDAPAFNTRADYALFTTKSESTLAIQGLPLEWERVGLQVNVAEAGMYQISADLENSNGTFIYLKDKLLDEIVDLQNNGYFFLSSAGKITNRFELVPGSSRMLDMENKKVKIYAYDKVLHIQQPEVVKREYSLFSIDGRFIFKTEVINSVRVDLNAIQPGIYLVFDGTKTHKIIVN